MRKPPKCRNCGGPISFVTSIKHYLTGKVIYASDYGKKAFPLCDCTRG